MPFEYWLLSGLLGIIISALTLMGLRYYQESKFFQVDADSETGSILVDLLLSLVLLAVVFYFLAH